MAQETLAQATGTPAQGWHSPARSHSQNTLTLLAERGFQYVTDWANDDMPYMITTKAGAGTLNYSAATSTRQRRPSGGGGGAFSFGHESIA